MDPRQRRIGQDNDAFKSGDSYSKLFTVIKAKTGQWFPFAKRPIDILTVVTPGSTTALLKRHNDNNHNGFPYRWIRPFDGVAGEDERVIVVNDPQGPWALGILSGDTPADIVTLTPGTNVSAVTTSGHVGMRGIISFTTTGAPAAGEVLFTATFTTALMHLPFLHAKDQNGNQVYGVANVTNSGFEIIAGPSGLPASTPLVVGYLAVL